MTTGSNPGRNKLPLSLLLLLGLIFCCTTTSDNSRQYFEDSETGSNETDSGANGNNTILGDVANKADTGLRSFWNESHNKLTNVLRDLSGHIPINVDYVLTSGLECDIVKNNRHFYFHIPLILSAVMVILGVVFGFFGYRLMKIVLFLIGFLIGFSIAYLLISALTHSRSEHWILYVALGAAIIVGILAGFLTICIYYIGIFLAGASIGFLVAWFILASIDIPFFSEHFYVPIIVAIIMGAVVGFIALKVQKWVFILGTSILRGLLIIWGLDYFLELGSMIYFLFLFAEHRSGIKPCWYSWSIVPLFVILVVAGLLIQGFVTGRKYNHKKEMNGVCCGLCGRNEEARAVSDGKGKYMKLEAVNKEE